ncbi:uncharacterized protein LOC135397609 isoform X2 [Ornithodoros turicata]|uniref:uncharacterized protein LOC135397609 isoform X2 n=1 Tax=Ornithodoros turicata TaxID=34597 RepID=UPI003139414E
MCCDSRNSILVYAICGCLYYGLVVYLIVKAEDEFQYKIIWYMNIASVGFSLLLYLILALAMVTVNKQLLGIFITYLEISVGLMILFVISDVILGIKVPTKGEKRMGLMGKHGLRDAAGLPDNQYPLLVQFEDGPLLKGVSILNETKHFEPDLDLRRRHRRADKGKGKVEETTESGIFLVWRMSSYYDTME